MLLVLLIIIFKVSKYNNEIDIMIFNNKFNKVLSIKNQIKVISSIYI